jgi:transcriptional regulator with XRE-family HTH domain
MDSIVVRARRVRKSIRAICLKAGVAPSTWSRWQSEVVAPNQSTLDRLSAALDEFEQA